MVSIDLGDHHGHVVGKTMGRVVGYHRALQPGVILLQRSNLILFHIHRAENKVGHGDDLFLIGHRVKHRHAGEGFGHRVAHGPPVPHRVAVGFPCRAGRSRQHGDLKPGMIGKQGGEALPHHSRCAENAYVISHGNSSNQSEKVVDSHPRLDYNNMDSVYHPFGGLSNTIAWKIPRLEGKIR